MHFWQGKWGDRDPMSYAYAQISPDGIRVKEEQWKIKDKRVHDQFFNVDTSFF